MPIKLLSACIALALAACAAAPTTPTASAAAPASDAATASATKLAAATPPPGCVSGTGTRLAVRPGTCTGFGNSYTLPQLGTTGDPPYLQNGLYILDPSVRINGVVP